jgi:shikimate dehydrogenase
MASAKDIAALQACVRNRLEFEPNHDGSIAGVIGAAPSRYSKSPALWNAAFAATGIPATYIPLDLENSRLKEFASVLKNTEAILGVNVTVPHKLAIMEFLDDLDASAARVKAVNTIVRTENGRLVGYNTDGAGFIASLLQPQPGRSEAFVRSLSGVTVLVLGAGGSARAVAIHVSELLGTGKLALCNRTIEHARALAEEIGGRGLDAVAIGEDELPAWAPDARIIVNCTTKGQGSSSLESYSALAAVFQSGDSADAVRAGVEKNHEASLRLAGEIPRDVRFYDLIYLPEETVFLRHARETGHQTMNGKAMIVCQAALAFANHICAAELRARGLDGPDNFRQLIATMYQAW